MNNPATIRFTSYEKIADTFSNWQIDEAGYRLLEKTQWVVTEKVHGANFCFITDGDVIQSAKRKRLLAEGETFFNHQIVLNKLQDKIQHAFLLVKQTQPDVNYIAIYGELFGGGYPHPDVEADTTVQPIQTGVSYSPTIEFYAFDIAVEYDNHQAVTRHYLDYDQAQSVFQQTDIFHAVPLLVSTWNEACAYPVGFDSTIPALLGLPPLPDQNPAEGIVIKPVTSIALDTNSVCVRPILKKKIAEFAEDKRFYQSQKWPPTQQAFPQNERLTLLKWEIFNLVTENRLHNAISKIGLIDSESASSTSRQLFNLLVADVLEALNANQAEVTKSLTEYEANELRNYLYQETRQLFKGFFNT
ncbi:MAG TPA: RNA ligase [Thioploca sp.]|nr:RNA ligase [Thioploca sp.]